MVVVVILQRSAPRALTSLRAHHIRAWRFSPYLTRGIQHCKACMMLHGTTGWTSAGPMQGDCRGNPQRRYRTRALPSCAWVRTYSEGFAEPPLARVWRTQVARVQPHPSNDGVRTVIPLQAMYMRPGNKAGGPAAARSIFSALHVRTKPDIEHLQTKAAWWLYNLSTEPQFDEIEAAGLGLKWGIRARSGSCIHSMAVFEHKESRAHVDSTICGVEKGRLLSPQAAKPIAQGAVFLNLICTDGPPGIFYCKAVVRSKTPREMPACRQPRGGTASSNGNPTMRSCLSHMYTYSG